MEVVQLKNHISKRREKIKYIVVHDTGNQAYGAGAKAHKNYFMTTNRKASADYLVEEDEIIKLNNYYKCFTWHCGDGKGHYGITNSNSIGIEMCINSDSNKQKTINSTIKLVYELMKELNIPIERVVRHYDASRKICPGSFFKDNWLGWRKFKVALKEYIDMMQSEEKYILLKLGQKSTVCETVLKDGYNFIRIREVLKFLGYEVESYSGAEIVIREQSKR